MQCMRLEGTSGILPTCRVPLELQSSSRSRAGSAGAGCSGLWPAGFGYLRRQTPQSCWTACAGKQRPPGMSRVSAGAHGFSSRQRALLGHAVPSARCGWELPGACSSPGPAAPARSASARALYGGHKESTSQNKDSYLRKNSSE